MEISGGWWKAKSWGRLSVTRPLKEGLRGEARRHRGTKARRDCLSVRIHFVPPCAFVPCRGHTFLYAHFRVIMRGSGWLELQIMAMNIDQIMRECKAKMDKSLEHYEKELRGLR